MIPRNKYEVETFSTITHKLKIKRITWVDVEEFSPSLKNVSKAIGTG